MPKNNSVEGTEEKEQPSAGAGIKKGKILGAVLFRIRRFRQSKENFPVSRLPRLENLRRTALGRRGGGGVRRGGRGCRAGEGEGAPLVSKPAGDS